MISVLCPSRGRPAKLAETIAILAATADHPDFEVLVACDPGDEATLQAALGCADDWWIAPERYGYARLSLYWDHLAKVARGDWLLLWNDDALMVTPGWDTIVHAQPPALLWSYTRGDDPAGNYFPFWPASWARLLGYTSPIPGPHVDTYLQFLGAQLGRVRRIPVEVEHERPYYPDPAANDLTYREGRLLLGSHAMVPGWDRAAVLKHAQDDAARIREAGL